MDGNNKQIFLPLRSSIFGGHGETVFNYVGGNDRELIPFTKLVYDTRFINRTSRFSSILFSKIFLLQSIKQISR